MKPYVLLSVAALILISMPLFANGVLIADGEDGDCFNLTSSLVNVQVEDQVAIVTTTQDFINQYNWPIVPKYLFPLPEGASATLLRWRANDKWFTANFAPVPQDSLPPGPSEYWATNILTYAGENPLYYNFEDLVQHDATIRVELTYVMLLPYSMGSVNFFYPNDYSLIGTPQLTNCGLTFDLTSQRTITALNLSGLTPTSYTINGNTASLTYLAHNEIPVFDYNVSYTLAADELGLFTMSTMLDQVPDEYPEGFFLFIAEPDPSDNQVVIDKRFTLIVDRSGSMSGTKIVQARNAANYIVNHLNPGDLFNIVSFSTDMTSFRPGHVPANAANITAALTYISGLVASGGTNISGAFSTAVPQFNDASVDEANIIIFFTDGQATAGITDSPSLRAHVSGLINQVEAPINLFDFGIGTDANVQLLTQMANDNGGIAQFLGSDQLEEVITGFYNIIANPVLIHPTIAFQSSGLITEVYPDPLPNLYIGSQMLVSGRYSIGGNSSVSFSGQAYNTPVTYDYQMELADSLVVARQFLSKIWAKQKIEHLLALYYSYPEDSPEAQSYREQIVEVSMAYGVISPFTSFQGGGNGGGGGGGGGGTENDDANAGDLVPAPYVLKGNFPNPFNPSTTISFSIARDMDKLVRIKIYNLRGQVIRILGLHVDARGDYQIVWNGEDMQGNIAPSGVYFYVIDFGDAQLSGKMTMTK